MKFIKSKRVAVLLVVAAAGIICGVAAYAYWTNTGSGSGSASVASPAANSWSFDVDAITPALYPGSASDISGTITNTSGAPAQIAAIAIDTTNSDSGVEVLSAPGTCDESNFSVDTLAIAGGSQEVAAGASVDFTGTLHMSDPSDANQDGCKGASLQVDLMVDNTGL